MEFISLLYPEELMGLLNAEIAISLMNPATVAITTAATMMSLYLYFVQPSMILQAYFRVAVRWSGMKIKCTKRAEDGFQFFYGERGQKVKKQATILLLHGFSADHFMWASIVQKLPQNVHVIALDLPGHGFTMEPLEGDDIGFEGQVQRIKQFLDLTELTGHPLHITGISMGGALAGLFAATYPQLVTALSLTCPSMKTPQESKVFQQNKERVLADGKRLTLENCPMLPQTAEEVQTMLNISHYYSVTYPSQILKGVAELRKKKNDFYLRLVNAIINEEAQELLENSLHLIPCPAQIIWGKEDWIVDVSGADVLREKLPNCRRVDILPKCGHAINLDQPGEFARIVMEFWGVHCSSSKLAKQNSS